MHPNRKKSRKDYGTFSSNQLRSKIFQLMTFIEGQYAGSYDNQDMHDGDFGHLARLVDMIDAYNMNNPDNKMDYPKIRDEYMSPVDWTQYTVNEGRKVRITKSQLRRIIREQAGDGLEEAAQLIYYALLNVEDELVDRGVELRFGEFAKAIEQAMQRFK